MGSDGGGTLRAALSALVDEPGAAALTTAEQAVAVRLQQQPSGAPVLQLMDEQGATLQLLPVADVEVRCCGRAAIMRLCDEPRVRCVPLCSICRHWLCLACMQQCQRALQPGA